MNHCITINFIPFGVAQMNKTASTEQPMFVAKRANPVPHIEYNYGRFCVPRSPQLMENKVNLALHTKGRA